MKSSWKPTFHRIHEHLSRSSRVLLATHERADGDAFGSLLAFRHLLSEQGREVVALAPDSTPEGYSHLEGLDDVLTDEAGIRVDGFDAVVLFDCGDVRRTHLAEKLHYLGEDRPHVILFDHHSTVTKFRERELVDTSIIDTDAAATCELVYRYVETTEARISPRIATAMLTGIITDTGGFVHANTTPEVMEISSELLKRGANLRLIMNSVVRSKNVGTLQLWGRALSRLEYDRSSGIVSTALRLKDFEECGVDREAVEGIANFLNSLGEGKMVLVLRQDKDGFVKGSFRTKRNDLDVAALAKQHGGGGHQKAAGFKVKGSIVKHDHAWSFSKLRAT